MRTTINTVYSIIGNNLNKITSDLNRINSQISSGRQMSKISDDPTNLVKALQYRTFIEELDQYTENIGAGNTIITSSEAALTQMKELALKSKTLAIQAIDPALTFDQRLAIAEEIKHVIEESVILANTQVNGKYIFGGTRTTGYTDKEPAPFIQDKGDGHWVNGTSLSPISHGLSSTIPGNAAVMTDIANGDFIINGENIGAIAMTPPALINGINMAGANTVTNAINTVTTSYSNSAATADPNDGIDSIFQFDLNGVTVNLTVSDNSSANSVATQAMTAINAESTNTGVTASLNLDTVVFQNTVAGDNSTIEVTNFTTTQNGGAALGFSDFSKKVVTTSLTTLNASGVASAETNDGTDSIISFDLNNNTVNVRIPDNSPAATVASITVNSINLMSDRTGVIAEVGDGTNGGTTNSIVFKNSQEGDSSAITISNYNSWAGDANPANLLALVGSQAADATHNTGQITMALEEPISITTGPTPTGDAVLDTIGLGGGGLGFMDDNDDGSLLFGYRLETDDLLINGTKVPATVDDGLSDKYGVFSAAAKADTINSITAQTGVTANIVPASMYGQGSISGGTELDRLTGVVTGAVITAGDLAVNGIILPAEIAISGGASNGLFMDSAANARNVINNEYGTTGVRSSLTTLYTDALPTADTANFINSVVSFDLNGETITVTLPDGSTAAQVASLTASEINSLSGITGVEAIVGDGTNGGAAGRIVFKNRVKGDNTAITVTNYSLDQGNATLGFGNFSQVADATHNTGEISLESDAAFTLTSPTTVPADTIFTQLGLQADTGTDQIQYGATPKYINTGDLVINGVDIFSSATAVLDKDQDNTLVRAINSKTSQTGVYASRTESGNIVLSVEDGRNIHIETSINGENITHLNGSNGEQIHFGSLKITSDRVFHLETTAGPMPNQYEPGFASLGLSGGETATGESGDISGDGKIYVHTIRNQDGAVRYSGDREKDLSIKIGKTDTMLVSENGKTAVADTGLFTILQAFEDALRNKNFTTVTGIHTTTDTSATLNSRATGLEPDSLLPDEDLFTSGNFSVTVSDNSYFPPKESTIKIGVDPDNDTLGDIAQRLNGIPHLSASWTSDGQLKLETSEPSRYSFKLDPANSNFLEVTGISSYFVQEQAFAQSLDGLDSVMNSISEQIYDFGARSNRISIQAAIYSEFNITTQENLSEVQDTDMIKAIMELKAKEVAYQAALSSAAKTMQLSLVDYL